MRLTCALILAFVLISIFILSYCSTGDFFSPLCIYSLFTFLKYVPNMAGKEYEALTRLNEDNVFKLFVIELIAIISVLVGYTIAKSRDLKNQRYIHQSDIVNETIVVDYSFSIEQWKVWLVFLIGIVARFQIVIKSGGVAVILGNVSQAYAGLSNGTGFYSLLANCVIIACMFQLYLLLQAKIAGDTRSYRRRILYLIIMIVLYSASFLIFSSRSPVFELVMYLAYGYNYLYKKLSLKSIFDIRVIAIILLSIAIIIIMPQLRNSSYGARANSFDKLTGRYRNETTFIESFVDEFSCVGRDAYVYETFNLKNYWCGKSYLGLATALIPYNLYHEKPPVDDGNYLSNMLYGYSVDPPMSRNQLPVKYSIPFTTPSILYTNFGVLGVIIGEIFMGILYAWAFSKVQRETTVFNILLFQLIVYQLELSTMAIMQTLLPLAICYIVFRLLTKARYSKIHFTIGT